MLPAGAIAQVYVSPLGAEASIIELIPTDPCLGLDGSLEERRKVRGEIGLAGRGVGPEAEATEEDSGSEGLGAQGSEELGNPAEEPHPAIATGVARAPE